MSKDIEGYIAQNKVIGLAMGVEPEIEYCVGSGEASCFHPKHCGISWPPQQKQACEKWVNEHKAYAEREGYRVQKEEWWPWYNQDWNKLMEVVEKIEAMGFTVSINGTGCSIMKDRFGEDILCSTSNWATKKEAVYYSVHGFCEWHLHQNNSAPPPNE